METGMASSTNFSDVYWEREHDQNYQKLVADYEEGKIQLIFHPKDISLYQFGARFKSNWSYTGELKIVLPTPHFQWVPSRGDPSKENEWYTLYCKSTLLLHKPGANPDNLLNGEHDGDENCMFGSYHDALLNFVNTVCCRW